MARGSVRANRRPYLRSSNLFSANVPLTLFSSGELDLLQQACGFDDSEKTKPLSKLLTIKVVSSHEIQQVSVSADQEVCARSDSEIDIRFVIRVARILKHPRDFPDHNSLPR